MASIVFDTRRYVQELRGGGISERQADVHAEALMTALQEGVATNAALLSVEAKLTVRLAAVEARLTVMDGRMDSLESKVDTLRWLVVVGMGLMAVWVPVVVFAAQIFLG